MTFYVNFTADTPSYLYWESRLFFGRKRSPGAEQNMISSKRTDVQKQEGFNKRLGWIKPLL